MIIVTHFNRYNLIARVEREELRAAIFNYSV